MSANFANYVHVLFLINTQTYDELIYNCNKLRPEVHVLFYGKMIILSHGHVKPCEVYMARYSYSIIETLVGWDVYPAIKGLLF